MSVVHLGHSCCFNCATQLKIDDDDDDDDHHHAATIATCSSCRKIHYCSVKCLREDADVSPFGCDVVNEQKRDDIDDSGGGFGCSSSDDFGGGQYQIVCFLLRLCKIDESVEDKDGSDGYGGGGVKKEKIMSIQKRIIIIRETHVDNVFSVCVNLLIFETIK